MAAVPHRKLGPIAVRVPMPPNSFFFYPDSAGVAACAEANSIYALLTFSQVSGNTKTPVPGTNGPYIVDFYFTYPQLTNGKSGATYPASTWGIHTSLAYSGPQFAPPSSLGQAAWDASGASPVITALNVDFGPLAWNNAVPPYKNVFLNSASLTFHTIPQEGGKNDILQIPGQWIYTTFLAEIKGS